VGLYPVGPGGLSDFPAGLYPVPRLPLQELLTRQRNNSRQPRRTDFRFTAVPVAGVISPASARPQLCATPESGRHLDCPACAVSGAE
jgi:hypothetical protein